MPQPLLENQNHLNLRSNAVDTTALLESPSTRVESSPNTNVNTSEFPSSNRKFFYENTTNKHHRINNGIFTSRLIFLHRYVILFHQSYFTFFTILINYNSCCYFFYFFFMYFVSRCST